jgi:hypothetical protein
MVALTVADAGDRIELGGLRRASARVRTVANDYRIDVRMTPITAFDEATNRTMNGEIARSCALQALARHLSKKPSVYLTVSGARVVKCRVEGKSFELTLLVPTERVKVIDGDAPPKLDGEKAERVLADASLFTRKAEYETTIFHLERALNRELDALIARQKVDPQGAARARFEALGEKIDAACQRLGKEIRGDLELSDIGSDLDPDDRSERDQLLSQLARSRQRLRARVDEALKKLPEVERP